MIASRTGRCPDRRPQWLVATISGLLACCLAASAHRLDEILQAARLAVAAGRVEVELDLTPGANTTAKILPLLDLDHDGRISALEGEAYADLVRSALTLEVDGQGQSLKVSENEFPSLAEMKAGQGMIRLKLSAEFAPLPIGPHQLFFRNEHQTNLSVYLVNALMPEAKSVEVTRQQRDPLQRELMLDFTIKEAGTNSPPKPRAPR